MDNRPAWNRGQRLIDGGPQNAASGEAAVMGTPRMALAASDAKAYAVAEATADYWRKLSGLASRTMSHFENLGRNVRETQANGSEAEKAEALITLNEALETSPAFLAAMNLAAVAMATEYEATLSLISAREASEGNPDGKAN